MSPAELDLVRELTVDDLPSELRIVAEEIGLDAAVKLARLWGGFNVYLPKLDRVLIPVRDRTIRRLRAEGVSVKELARQFGLTDTTVYSIVNAGPDARQEALFPSSNPSN